MVLSKEQLIKEDKSKLPKYSFRNLVRKKVYLQRAFIGNCIDSIRFVNDNLYIKWNNSAGKYNTDKDKVDLIGVEI